MNKSYRHGQILNLIRKGSIRTQEELSSALKKSGIDVTQVTLSRDIHELGLIKGPRGYQEHQRADNAAPADRTALHWVLKEFVRDVTAAGTLVVIKTASGNAQPVAESIDRESWPEIAGTLAGENTVFAAATDGKAALRVRQKILALLR